ncbi:hypothetical protein [Nitratidesulfovibrio vulgaris]|jgi:hypothetical protein|uniref:Superoxide dismutase n=2 Tax=Nitratidesulfovibrio vulgaris TaxID=881 RepID=Q729D1_NITV2|nr:hypothetical protein [Nitratidesulfovibrio vulgaris]GEB81039.1 hypothetical protein DDE01_24540 [Desulfovibrio desulfuricans]HBW17317.1 hypothetical protein [Desulfovibrio sp.]AAS96893.1 conserved hypothetical protein [Nitratidesulfovibrio vulgaris str. Hildenborough]ABM27832.1 conserved hypothetical protein [Nitratidesulfovibrio vulgaris DP4]ADP87383.1 hypothetical protein Deval_2239 [Nitratidesulfovibrio vulgaris RCH1]
MKILAIDKVRDKATPERIRELFLKEISQCVRLYLADVVREMYFRQDRSGTVLVLEAPSVDDARAMLRELPLVREKQVEFDLIPLGPYVPLGLLLQDEEETPAQATVSAN